MCLSLSLNNTVEWCSQRCKTKEKIHEKGIFRRFWQGEELSKTMKVYSLGRKPFLLNDTGYGIIFQKCLSITCEELFKGWNRWLTGESTPPLLQDNSQKLGTSLWPWQLISLLCCSRGNVSITCSLPGAGHNSVWDKMYLEKICVSLQSSEIFTSESYSTLMQCLLYL